MGFAVFHPGKGSGAGGGIGSHIDRKEGQEHTYPHADAARRALNINRALPSGRHLVNLPEAINERIKEGYTGKKAIRKDGVRFLSLVLTGTHEDMIKLAADAEKFKKWQQANYEFVKKEFGEANIMRFTLHLDEKTPHIHAIVVPLTSDGRLSAKELMGNKKNLSLRQDRYAEAMETFGLIRGVRDSKANHTGEGWYLEQLREAREAQNKPAIPTFGVMEALRPAKFLNDVKSSLTVLQQENTDLKLESLRREKQVSTAQAGLKKTESNSAEYKSAVEDMAEQLISAGKEGVKMDTAYALLDAPAALKRAANVVFMREVKKFEQDRLKAIALEVYQKSHRITDIKQVTQGNHDLLKDELKQELAAVQAAINFDKEVFNRWGVKFPAESKMFEQLKKNALEYIHE
ncbi:MAG: hypothetical protein EOP41_08685, partial [Sphingobacteriaceae bacterium]